MDKKENLNIWYFHHYATPFEIAGLHRPFEFGECFKREGNDITVFTSSFLHYVGSNMINDSSKMLVKTYNGIKTVFVRTCDYSDSGMKRVKNMFQFGSHMKPVVKQYLKNNSKPDIIIASSPHPFTLYFAEKIAKKLRVPCICEVRDLWPEVFFYGGRLKENSLIGKMLLKGERYLYKKADGIVFLKEGDHTYIEEHKWDTKHGGNIDMEKCFYVNNGVNLEAFDQKQNEYHYSDDDLDSDKFKVIYCGTIRPVNNVDMLVDVGKNLGNDVEIIIFGSGSCEKEIAERIRDEKITNVKLKGYVDNKYISSILSRASVNILNYSGTNYNWSRGNSSNKLFEYLASKKPVVSTVRMGYDILKKYNCGISAKECNAVEIAKSIECIKNLSKEEYETMCENAREASTHFEIKNLAAKYIDAMKETADRRRKNG